MKDISETSKNEAKEQKEGFLFMSLGTLAAIILENALTGKGVIRAGEGVTTASEHFQCHLIL